MMRLVLFLCWVMIGSMVLVLGTGAAILLTRSPNAPTYQNMLDLTVVVNTDTGHGSGVIVGPHQILTVRHVTEDMKGGDGNVTMAGGKVYKVHVEWISGDPEDYAMLVTDNILPKPYAQIGCSPLQVGDQIWAVGFPQSFGKTLVSGVISSRAIDQSDTEGPPKTLIGVSMPMVPGMSGGPVFNQYGQVVGLNDELFLMALGGFLPAASGLGAIVPMDLICSAQLPRV
jgi:serine protease Do